MLHTKEFYDMMSEFDKYAKKEIRMGNMGLTKESKENWERRIYYTDGSMNDSFKIYMAGYMNGRIEYM